MRLINARVFLQLMSCMRADEVLKVLLDTLCDIVIVTDVSKIVIAVIVDVLIATAVWDVGLDLEIQFYDTTRDDTRCYFNVRSKSDMSRLDLPHGNDN